MVTGRGRGSGPTPTPPLRPHRPLPPPARAAPLALTQRPGRAAAVRAPPGGGRTHGATGGHVVRAPVLIWARLSVNEAWLGAGRALKHRLKAQHHFRFPLPGAAAAAAGNGSGPAPPCSSSSSRRRRPHEPQEERLRHHQRPRRQRERGRRCHRRRHRFSAFLVRQPQRVPVPPRPPAVAGGGAAAGAVALSRFLRARRVPARRRYWRREGPGVAGRPPGRARPPPAPVPRGLRAARAAGAAP